MKRTRMMAGLVALGVLAVAGAAIAAGFLAPVYVTVTGGSGVWTNTLGRAQLSAVFYSGPWTASNISTISYTVNSATHTLASGTASNTVAFVDDGNNVALEQGSILAFASTSTNTGHVSIFRKAD